MKKALAILLIALFVVTLFVGLGCQKKEEAPPEGTTMEETTPMETAPVDTAAAETGTMEGN